MKRAPSTTANLTAALSSANPPTSSKSPSRNPFASNSPTAKTPTESSALTPNQRGKYPLCKNCGKPEQDSVKVIRKISVSLDVAISGRRTGRSTR